MNQQDELQIQYEIHSSIDFVEEKLKTGKKDTRELYLGLLYSTEEHKVYPFALYCLTTIFVLFNMKKYLSAFVNFLQCIYCVQKQVVMKKLANNGNTAKD